MEYISNMLRKCGRVERAGATGGNEEEDLSEIQLNAFEFRHYRSTLDQTQHKLVERVVNQWCGKLVRGTMMRVRGFEEKVWLDRDMLGLEISQEYFPLKEMVTMQFGRDPEDPTCTLHMLELGFKLKVILSEPRRVVKGDWTNKFTFDQEQKRLHFALTLRILRARDPTLDAQIQSLEVSGAVAAEEDEQPLSQVVSNYRYKVESRGIPIIFTVSDLKLFKEIESSSRHVYLEFFVRYPRQDPFLYAKSNSTTLPKKALQEQDTQLLKNKEGNDDEEEDKRKGKREEVIEEILFDMRNMKLKLPAVPHTILGRLMAKDDLFPTAVGTFNFVFRKKYIQDRRTDQDFDDTQDGRRRDAEELQLDVIGTKKLPKKVRGKSHNQEAEFPKIGVLTLRCLGYITDDMYDNHRTETGLGTSLESKSSMGSGIGAGEEEEEESDEEDGSEDNNNVNGSGGS